MSAAEALREWFFGACISATSKRASECIIAKRASECIIALVKMHSLAHQTAQQKSLSTSDRLLPKTMLCNPDRLLGWSQNSVDYVDHSV